MEFVAKLNRTGPSFIPQTVLLSRCPTYNEPHVFSLWPVLF